MLRLVVPPRVEAVWRAVDGLMHRSKWQSRSGIWEKSNSERRGKREERREKRDGSVPEGRDGGEKGRPLGFHKRSRLVSVAFLVLVGIALVQLFLVDCHDVGSIWSGHRASAFMVPQGRL